MLNPIFLQYFWIPILISLALVCVSFRLARKSDGSYPAMPSAPGMIVLCTLFIPLFFFVARLTKSPQHHAALTAVTLWASLFAVVMLRHILEQKGIITIRNSRPRRFLHSDDFEISTSPTLPHYVYEEGKDIIKNSDNLEVRQEDEKSEAEIMLENMVLGYYGGHMSNGNSPWGEFSPFDQLEPFDQDLIRPNTVIMNNSSERSDSCATNFDSDILK